MPTYSTPDPIVAVIEFEGGDARILASERDDTVVEVRPSDESRDNDVRAAEQTRVEYSAGRLLVKGPKQRNPFGKPGMIDVTVSLPHESRLQATVGLGAFRGEGRLGDCQFKSGLGDIVVASTGVLDVSTGSGTVTVNQVTGTADVSTGSGQIRLGHVHGNAVIKSSNGDVWLGEIDGDLRVKGANGRIEVEHARAGVEATTANGDLRVGGLARGMASLKTSLGAIEIGIRAGTAAKLDVHTQFGKVRTEMDATGEPGPADQAVEVHARTSMGDITIRRTPDDRP
jgi:Putative adhesin